MSKLDRFGRTMSYVTWIALVLATISLYVSIPFLPEGRKYPIQVLIALPVICIFALLLIKGEDKRRGY